MNRANDYPTFHMDSETALARLDHQLARRGLRVVRSFDLQSACASQPGQVCPHHGDAPCDCQMVILLVYGAQAAPASVVLHSHRGMTDIDLVDTPGNRPDTDLVEEIQAAFLSMGEPPWERSEQQELESTHKNS
jgi:hypothetical protein